jgi:glycosyltransferase involved in cell wall biosynthesis
MLKPLLVGDLIKNPLIKKSSEFDQLNPEISIILPTYCRGKSGLFKKCVDSILSQTFNNFELIIVDDASSDGTQDSIIDYINIDPRIICIRHEKNVGLPAISCYEAYKISRAEKIFFAFDDNFYSKDAVEILYQDQIENPDHLVTFAATKMHISDKESVILGNEDFKYEKIINYNYIPNSPMLIDKSIIADIGFYDPHICISRLCDWDLWVRIGKRYNFNRIDKILAEELGPSQKDSLGNTHKVDLSLVREWIHYNRNEKLKIENFHNYNINEIPEFISYENQFKIYKLIQEKKIINSSNDYIVVISEYDASYSLTFSYLPEEIEKRIITIPYLSIINFGYHDLISNANAVIFIRKILDLSIELSIKLTDIQVPYYYYLDDNLFEIFPEYKSGEKLNFINKANGVLVSTEELKNYITTEKINDNVIILGPTIETLIDNFDNCSLSHFDDIDEINFCFYGNSRFDGLCNLIPALSELGQNFKINLYCFSRVENFDCDKISNLCKKNNITLKLVESEINFQLFINKLKALKIHFVIHPEGKGHLIKMNYKYKTFNSIIAPALSSSIILLPDLEVYKKLNLPQLKYKDNESFILLVKKLLNDKDFLKNTYLEQRKICIDIFNNKNTYEVVKKIIHTPKKKFYNKFKLENSLELENVQIKFLGKKINLTHIKNKKYKLLRIICVSRKNKITKIKLFGITLVKIKQN